MTFFKIAFRLMRLPVLADSPAQHNDSQHNEGPPGVTAM